MTAVQDVSPNPDPAPQFNALSAGNALVTVTIGGNDTGNGCWPKMPVARGDVAWLRSKQVELNAMLAQQAAAHGARVADDVPANPAAPLHPNLRGMQAMAGMVVTAASAP